MSKKSNSSGMVALMQLAREECWLIAGLFVAIVGCRLWVFSYAGSPLPYYDQWIGEYDRLYLSLIGGEPAWRILFLYHNEHRIVTTKLLSLIGYKLNGYWDVHFLVLLAAVARGIEGVLLFLLLVKPLQDAKRLLVLGIITFFFCLPLSGYNLMSGFQIQFFLSNIAVLLALLFFLHWDEPLKCGVLLVAIYIFGLLSFSTSLILPGVLLTAYMLQPQRKLAWLPVFTLLLALGAGFYLTKPAAAATSNLTSNSNLSQQLEFFLKLASWPLGYFWAGALLLSASTILAIFLVKSKRNNCQHSAAGGLLAYGLGNALVLALTRGPEFFHMRHWDSMALIAIGMVALFAGGISKSFKFERSAICAVVLLAVFYLTAAVKECTAITIPYLKAAHNQQESNLEHYRTMLLTKNFDKDILKVLVELVNNRFLFTDDPLLRYALHPSTPQRMYYSYEQALSILSPEIIPFPARKLSILSRVTKGLIDSGMFLAIIGIFCLVTANVPVLKRTCRGSSADQD